MTTSVLTVAEKIISANHVASDRKGPVKIQVDLLDYMSFDSTLRSAWESLRTTSPAFRSPFFSLEFLDSTACTRDDARMLVIRKHDEVVGFLPIQLVGANHALPLGGLFNDSHGILHDPQAGEISYLEVLRAANLKSYTFHALATFTPEVEKWKYGTVKSFLADLDRHENGYVDFLEKARETIFKQRRKTKKMIKDLGPMRLEFDCTSEETRNRILDLKREQYKRTHIFDILSVEWVHRMFASLFKPNSNRNKCRGITSVLYAGDTLVAGHVGLIEGDMMHYWFPVYDPQYHMYSPGTALFLEISNACEAYGIKQVDFGYGEQPYKVKLTDTISDMHYGRFDVSCARWYCKYLTYIIAMKRKVLPFREQIKFLLRKLNPNFGAKRYQ